MKYQLKYKFVFMAGIAAYFKLFDKIKQRRVKETGWPYGQQITNQIHLKILKYNEIKKISQYFSFEL